MICPESGPESCRRDVENSESLSRRCSTEQRTTKTLEVVSAYLAFLRKARVFIGLLLNRGSVDLLAIPCKSVTDVVKQILEL